jgi:site-specific recombinase XerD
MFRHALAMRMLDAGATDLEVIKTLGHASISQTIIYNHSTKKFALRNRARLFQNA